MWDSGDVFRGEIAQPGQSAALITRRSRVQGPLSLREYHRKGARLPHRLMWRICSCGKRGCTCRRAFREPFRECFDCWDGSHYYEKPKEGKVKHMIEWRLQNVKQPLLP